MLAKTRVSTTPDIQLMGESLARPGMDPRTWKSLAVVTAVHFDPDHGYLADVMLLPSGAACTARVGSVYAGPGFGLFAPLEVDDEVAVSVPNGDPAAGLVIDARLHDNGTPPPREIADHPTDLLLLAKEGATVRISVQGSGNVVVEARGTGTVLLGNESASRGVARIDDSISVDTSALVASMVAAGFSQPFPAPPLPVGGVVSSASDKVRST